MDDVDLAELSAAIVAHYEWLKTVEVRLPVPAEELRAPQLLNVALDRGDLAAAVATSLTSLCALRTRQTIREDRAKARHEGPPALARKVTLLTDDSHFEPLKPALVQLRERLRTAVRKLTQFEDDLDTRHRKFIKAGLVGSGAPIDADLTRWLSAICTTLEMDVDFFMVEMEGPVAMGSTGHAAQADGKAWHRVRSNALVTLERAGMKSRERLALFPTTRFEKGDAEDPRRSRSREQKARKRAEKRGRSSG